MSQVVKTGSPAAKYGGIACHILEGLNNLVDGKAPEISRGIPPAFGRLMRDVEAGLDFDGRIVREDREPVYMGVAIPSLGFFLHCYNEATGRWPSDLSEQRKAFGKVKFWTDFFIGQDSLVGAFSGKCKELIRFYGAFVDRAESDADCSLAGIRSPNSAYF